MKQKKVSRRKLRAGRLIRIDSILTELTKRLSFTIACVSYDDGFSVVAFDSLNYHVLASCLDIGQLECFVAGYCSAIGYPFSNNC